MTALNFILDPECIIVATDALKSDASDKSPMSYCSKVFALPHLDAILVGTGMVTVIQEWANCVQMDILARNMIELDRLTPERLRYLYEDAAMLYADPKVTIYHFGYDPGEECYAGYAYRSTNDFLSERLPYGLGVKPNVLPMEEIEQYSHAYPDLQELLIQLMIEQRQRDEVVAYDERVGIGGQIYQWQLANHSIHVVPVFSFLDYKHMFNDMRAKLHP